MKHEKKTIETITITRQDLIGFLVREGRLSGIKVSESTPKVKLPLAPGSVGENILTDRDQITITLSRIEPVVLKARAKESDHV